MRVHVHRLVLLLLLLLALPVYAEGPQALHFPGTAVTGATSGGFTNLHVGPGGVSITGGSNNGNDQISNVNVNGVANVKSFGAYGDVAVDFNYDCSMPANSNVLTCPSAVFRPSDVGKTVFVPDVTTQAITSAANNGSGAVRLTMASTANLNASLFGASVRGIHTGTVEANGVWAFAIIDATHVDLLGSTFANAWVAPGTGAEPTNFINPHSATLDTTITGYTSSTSVTVGATRTFAVSGQNLLWGHDDTTAMQNAYNSPPSTLYFPAGGYLNRGQNWNEGTVGFKQYIYGDGSYGGSTIWSVNVTDPGHVTGATTVGVMHSGIVDTIRGIAFNAGFGGAPDTSPMVDFASVRWVGGPGYQFNILHTFDDISISAEGFNTYGMVLHGSEQTHLQNMNFGADYGPTALFMASACNTPNFLWPWGTTIASGTTTSMTFVSMDGKRNNFSSWNSGNQNHGAQILLDQACNPFAIYNHDYDKVFTNQNNCVFLRDNYTGSATNVWTRFINVRDFYSEPKTPIDQWINVHAQASNWNISGEMYYAPLAPGNGVIPLQFGLALLNSHVAVDITGNSVGTANTVFANTCLGTWFNLGLQQKGIGGCTDWLYNEGYDYPFGANHGGEMQPSSLVIQGGNSTSGVGKGHMGAAFSAGAPSVTGGTLLSGSSDTFGWITLTAAGPATVTWANGWQTATNNIACALTDVGQPELWWTSSNTKTSIVFNCSTLAGAACPAGNIVQYHCGGIGGP